MKINIWLLHLVGFLSLHTLLTMHGHRNLMVTYIIATYIHTLMQHTYIYYCNIHTYIIATYIHTLMQHTYIYYCNIHTYINATYIHILLQHTYIYYCNIHTNKQFSFGRNLVHKYTWHSLNCQNYVVSFRACCLIFSFSFNTFMFVYRAVYVAFSLKL